MTKYTIELTQNEVTALKTVIGNQIERGTNVILAKELLLVLDKLFEINK